MESLDHSRLQLVLEVVLLEATLVEQKRQHQRLCERVLALEKHHESMSHGLQSLKEETESQFGKWKNAHNTVVCQVLNLKRLGRSLEACLPDYYANLEQSEVKRKRILCDRHMIQPYQCHCPGHRCLADGESRSPGVPE